MPIDYTSMTLDGETEEERRRRLLAQQSGTNAQTATNSTDAAKTAQTYSQPSTSNVPSTVVYQPQGVGDTTDTPTVDYSTRLTRERTAGPGGPRTRDDEWNPPPVTTPVVVQPPVPGDTSQWDTNGYAKPLYTVSGSAAPPAGWEASKWTNVNHQSPKYVVGRIMSMYPPTTGSMSAVVADIAKAYPGSTAVGSDKVNIPGVGTIDVLQNAAGGGTAWQWIDQASAGGTTGGATAGGATGATSGGATSGGTPTFGGGATYGGESGGQTSAAPRYQSYNYTMPGVTLPTSPSMISPETVSTYRAGTAPTYTPANTTPALGLAQTLAQQSSPYQSGAGGGAMDAGLQQLMQALGLAVPDAAAMKEAQKETLLAQTEAEREALQQRAQAMGLSRSGSVLGGLSGIDEGFRGDLTKAYRDIDLETQQRGFSNLLGAGNALSNLGTAQNALARGDYASMLAGQAQDFDQSTTLAELLQSIARGDYESQLAGSGQQAQMDQAAAASGLAGANYQLGRDQFAQQTSQQGFQNQLAQADLSLRGQQLQAEQVQAANQLGLSYAQLEQNAAQVAAQMGFNYAQLNSQDQRFLREMALKEAEFTESKRQFDLGLLL